MVRLGVLFLVIALTAALLAFGWVADLSYPAARVVFCLFLALAILSFLAGILEQGKFQDV